MLEEHWKLQTNLFRKVRISPCHGTGCQRSSSCVRWNKMAATAWSKPEVTWRKPEIAWQEMEISRLESATAHFYKQELKIHSRDCKAVATRLCHKLKISLNQPEVMGRKQETTRPNMEMMWHRLTAGTRHKPEALVLPTWIWGQLTSGGEKRSRNISACSLNLARWHFNRHLYTV